MKLRCTLRRGLLRSAMTPLVVVAGACLSLCLPAYGAERVTLRTGFEFDCARRVVVGDRMRLYLMTSADAIAVAGSAGQSAVQDANYIEVTANSVLRVETIPDPVAADAAAAGEQNPPIAQERGMNGAPGAAEPTAATMNEMLARAGALHNIDVDLLASVVQAESNGNARAVSRAGAAGLMQLMPGTASELGVRDRFAPEENIGGGTAYLDAQLTRYHDNIALAVAAYNAGPEAVDRYHGIPPYAETRAYVARVIREFNRRKRTEQAAQRGLMAAAK